MLRICRFGMILAALWAGWCGASSCFAEIVNGNRSEDITVTDPVTYTVPNHGDTFQFTGTISGAGNITKDGDGTLEFVPTAKTNPATGTLTVNSGILKLTGYHKFTEIFVNRGMLDMNIAYSNPTDQCLPRTTPITVGNANGDIAILKLSQTYAMNQDQAAFVLYKNGTIDLAKGNNPQNIATDPGKPFTFVGGGTIVGLGNWQHGFKNTIVTGKNAVALVSCNKIELTADAKVDVQDASSVLTVTSPIVSYNSEHFNNFTKNGAGTLVFSNTNSYRGATNINAGTVKFDKVSALGTTSGINVASNAVLGFGTDFDAADTYAANVIFQPGSGIQLEIKSSTEFAELDWAKFTITNPENMNYLYLEMDDYTGDPLKESYTLISGLNAAFPDFKLVQTSLPMGYAGVLEYANGAYTLGFREVPEPSSFLLFAGLVLGWGFVRFRRRS